MNANDQLIYNRAKKAALLMALPSGMKPEARAAAERRGFACTDELLPGAVTREELRLMAMGHGQALNMLKVDISRTLDQLLRQVNEAIASTQKELDYLDQLPPDTTFQSVRAYADAAKQHYMTKGPPDDIRNKVMDLFRAVGVPEDLLQQAVAEADAQIKRGI